ncbi:hypothetical protein [Lentzea sp.]|uniref:hypothetical protein n=1 Tax=Lentzea sp. TaxID=56099 RepID=UPI002ED41E2F
MTTTVSPVVRPLVRHGAEMLVAMQVGMALPGQVWTPERVELAALWMAVPYLVLLVPHWWSAACGVFDLVIAVTILLRWF